jgi:phytoene synthase
VKRADTFRLATGLLPWEVRDDVNTLYRVFRTLDDLVDEQQRGARERVAAVETWCHDGSVGSREAGMLDDLASRHPIPRQAIQDFCTGMRFDLDGGRNETEADVDRYCHQVAGTVGLTMAAMLGARGEAAERAAADLGKAMQRTNILRDIDEDLAGGRVYLARETLERFGGAQPGRRSELLRDQIARADALYERGIAGIALLPRGRRGVAAAAAMYREILRQIEREGYGARPGRAVVSPPRKIVIAARRVALSR